MILPPGRTGRGGVIMDSSGSVEDRRKGWTCVHPFLFGAEDHLALAFLYFSACISYIISVANASFVTTFSFLG